MKSFSLRIHFNGDVHYVFTALRQSIKDVHVNPVKRQFTNFSGLVWCLPEGKTLRKATRNSKTCSHKKSREINLWSKLCDLDTERNFFIHFTLNRPIVVSLSATLLCFVSCSTPFTGVAVIKRHLTYSKT